MEKTDIEAICTCLRRGGKMSIGRNHTGRTKIKLRTGPFGMFVKRYDASDEQIEEIKANLGVVSAQSPVDRQPKFNARHSA